MDDSTLNKGGNSTKPQDDAQQRAAKKKRLESALRDNLARRKEAQKSRPHRKQLAQDS